MAITFETSSQTQADVADPLLASLRTPNSVSIPSSLRSTFDTSASGVMMINYPVSHSLLSEILIGTRIDMPARHVFSKVSFENACYAFYGFNSFVSTMTPEAKSLLRNMITNPTCNYPQFLPKLNN